MQKMKKTEKMESEQYLYDLYQEIVTLITV